jgi:hypothetical protein
LAAGLGIVALRPSFAHAAVFNCCPQSSPCLECEQPLTDYHCDCSAAGTESYCLNQCRSDTGCYSGPC